MNRAGGVAVCVSNDVCLGRDTKRVSTFTHTLTFGL